MQRRVSQPGMVDSFLLSLSMNVDQEESSWSLHIYCTVSFIFFFFKDPVDKLWHPRKFYADRCALGLKCLFNLAITFNNLGSRVHLKMCHLDWVF